MDFCLAPKKSENTGLLFLALSSSACDFVFPFQATFRHVYALLLVVWISTDTLAVILNNFYLFNGNVVVFLDIEILGSSFWLKCFIECIYLAQGTYCHIYALLLVLWMSSETGNNFE